MTIFSFLLSWWGLWLLALLDSTMVFFLPVAVDMAVIILASHSPAMAWAYPIVASAGSLCGAAITYYVGRRLGEAGLERYVSKGRLIRIRQRIKTKGAVAIAILDLLPPPFPFTAFILAAGAFRVNTYRFFIALFLSKLLRFGVEAALAVRYGEAIIQWFKSGTFEYIALGLFVAAMLGTALTVIKLVQSTRTGRTATRERAA